MRNIALRLMTLGLFVLFVAALSMALVSGMKMYSSIAEANKDVTQHRAVNGAIVNTVHAMDSWDAVTVGETDDGIRALVIRQNTTAGVFENRIYLWDGDVILEFAPAQDAYDPDRGVKLVSSETFDFTIDGSLVSVTTDEGTTNIALVSGEGKVS